MACRYGASEVSCWRATSWTLSGVRSVGALSCGDCKAALLCGMAWQRVLYTRGWEVGKDSGG